MLKREAIASEVDALRLSLSESERRLRLAKADLDTVEESLRRQRAKFVEAQSAGRLKRLVKGLDPERLQRGIDEASGSVDSKMLLVRELSSQAAQVATHASSKEKEATSAEIEVRDLLRDFGMSEGQLEVGRKGFEQRRDNILARVAEIGRELDELRKRILSEARLVATTLTKTYVSKQFPDAPFDVIVLDEASMAPLPHLYWATSRCRDAVTIIGDFLQLPPICHAEDKPMARKWLGRSIFGVLGVDNVQNASADPRVKLLDTQYRMAPEISAIPNRLFYQNKLIDHPSVCGRVLDDGVSQSALVLLDTSAVNPWCTQLSAGSRFNLYHALVCATLGRRLTQTVPGLRVGVLTPYGPQARLTHKIARDWGLLERLRIATIHSFQGGEEKIVIFDTTEGLGPRVAPMLDEVRTPGSGASLVLNVALTRAQSRVYLVAHTKKLLAELHPDSALCRVIRHFQSNAEVLDSGALVDKYFTADFERWAGILLSPTAPVAATPPGILYTQRSFWPEFLEDLKSAERRVIVNSPFLTVDRASKFMDYFRSMVERGIEITVHTWPSSRHEGNMARQSEAVIAALRSIGVRVVERYQSKKHFKTAIIDDRVLWDGSLNILSYRDTEEHMWRLEGSSAIEQIVSDLQFEEDMPSGCQLAERCPAPGCGGFLVVRSKHGRKFFGCSNFAKTKCRYTRPLGAD